MKRMKIKNILIVMLIAIEVVATYFMYKSSTNKEVVLDNVELKELTDKSSFAIYLDGKEYTTSTTWPASATFEKAECQNEKGDILTGVLTFNESENKAYLNNATQTTYCYLYFATEVELAPTCSFTVNAGGVTLVPSNATGWYMSKTSTTSPTYGTSEAKTSVGAGTYYGYVRNASGKTGTCQLEMYKATVNSCTVTGTHTEGSGSGTCHWTYVQCECWDKQEKWVTHVKDVNSCQNLPKDEGTPSYNCSKTCTSANGSNTWGGYTADCSCTGTSGPLVYECSNGMTCGAEGCCANMPCSVDSCKSGYLTLTIDPLIAVFCYK